MRLLRTLFAVMAFAFAGPVFAAPQAIVPTSGATSSGTGVQKGDGFGGLMPAVPGRDFINLDNPVNLQNGLKVFGDSLPCSGGATDQTASGTGWTGRLNAELVAPVGTLTNYCHSGDLSADAASKVFTNLNQGESGNAPVIIAIGANDADVTEDPITYNQLIAAAVVRAGTSSINTVAASSCSTTGTWTNDTTFSPITGLQSTVSESTTTCTIYTPTGHLFLYYGLYAAGGSVTGGTFTVTVDGTPVTDTITNSSTLSSLPVRGTFSTGSGLTRSEAVAHYAVGVTSSTVPHTVVVTTTSASGAARPVNFTGLSTLAAPTAAGNAGLRVFLQGVPYQENDANSTGTAARDVANAAMAKLLASFGMGVTYVDVRAFTNYGHDMASATTQGCAGSGAGGNHGNDCWHRHVANAYEAYMGYSGGSIGPGTVGGPVNTGGIAAPTNLDTGTSGTTNASGDQGLTISRGTWCVGKYAQICWGETFVQMSGPTLFLNVLTYNSNSGGVAFSGIQSGATITTIRSGIQYRFLYDNSWILGAYAAGTSAGVVTFSGQLIGKGTAANDNAAAGYIGELISGSVASGSAVSLTTATPANIGSVSLPAGDYECWASADYTLTAATSSAFKSGISSTSATFGAQDTFANIPLITTLLSDTFVHNTPSVRMSLASTTTVYLVGQSTFSAGSEAAYGTLRCRRAR